MDDLFKLSQHFLHAKSDKEALKLRKDIQEVYNSSLNDLETETKSRALEAYNKSIGRFILDRYPHVCLYAFERAGVGCAGGRGPWIESLNANFKFQLGEYADEPLDVLIFKVA